MPDVFEQFTSLDKVPEGQENPEANAGTQNNDPASQPGAGTANPPAGGTPPKPDEFIESFNKRYSTQYKTDEDIKGLFELPKKISEYDEKLKNHAELTKSVDQYKKDLEEQKRTEVSRYLSSPLMQRAYVANELLKKNSKGDLATLTELAMSDIDKMSDLDVLARVNKLKVPDKSLDVIKEALLDELGIDTTLDPKEWDQKALTRLALKASDARKYISDMMEGVEVPKVLSKEEMDRLAQEAASKKESEVAPHRAEYLKFDKVKILDDLEYTVPDEFKADLPGMFDTFMIKAGNEPTPENIEALNDLREALFFNKYKKEIYDVMYKDAESKIKKALDDKLGNTKPPNSAQASDGAGGQQPSGASKFMEDLKSEGRAKSI